MKIVKWLIAIIVLLSAVLAIGGMVITPKFTVARDVVIKAPADKIYSLLIDPHEWKKWSVWNKRDPAMQIVYTGPQSGVGAEWSWKSKSEGDGTMTFTQAEPSKLLAYQLFFPDFGTTSNGDFRLEPAGDATRVTWAIRGDMGNNPMMRWMSLFADRVVGKDFEDGLANLRSVAEQ